MPRNKRTMTPRSASRFGGLLVVVPARSRLRRGVFFLTAIDGGMIRSFVRRQRNRTVSVGVLAPKPAPGKRLVKLSFFETPDGRTTGCLCI